MKRQLVADLVDEAVASMAARPGRVLLTALGPTLGVAALVATLGLAATAGNHIVARFDALAATEVVVAPRDPTTAGPAADAGTPVADNRLPWDGPARLTSLNGVRAAGTLSKISMDPAHIRAVDRQPDRTATSAALFATSTGLLNAVRGEVDEGRWFDSGHERRGDYVAVLGRTLADQIGLGPLARQPAVLVGDQIFAVIGVIEKVAREPELLNAVIIPDSLGQQLFGLEHPSSIHVDTTIGAARLIARQAPYALAAATPELIEARLAPEPAATRAKVDSDTRALFLLLGGLSVVVGGLGIANTTFVAVLERQAEIGLRRSVGATRTAITMQFLVESTGLGLLGGITGASLGSIIVVGVAAAKEWTPVLDPWLPVAGAAFGGVLGLVAGFYPSLRASRLEPMTVLRGE